MKTARWLTVAMVVCLSAAHADDWPQWRGPERTGRSAETGLLKQWPEEGPTKRWTATGLGDGYSTVAVAAGRVYLMGCKDGKETLFVLDEKTGRKLWTGVTDENTRKGGRGVSGPMGTPTVEGKHVYAIGASGLVTCWHLDTEKVIWQKHLVNDLGGRKPGDGYSESPLVVGKALIVTPGARGGGIVVALDKKTGKVIWKDSGVRDRVSQCSPILANINGRKVIVHGLGRGTVGIDAETGRFLWVFRPPTAHAATPIVYNGMVFNSTGYGKGSGVGRIAPGGVETVWHNRKLGNHHGGVVRVGDYLYGMLGARRGRELYCVEFKTGRVAWKDPGTGKGSLVYADGHLYCFGENQRVTLVEATPESYRQKGQFQLPRDGGGHAWAHPVVANGGLFIRHGDALYCYNVKGK